jgi:hypothetical protein
MLKSGKKNVYSANKEAAEKQRLKDEQELADLVDLQLQNDVVVTPKASKRPKKQIYRQKSQRRSLA